MIEMVLNPQTATDELQSVPLTDSADALEKLCLLVNTGSVPIDILNNWKLLTKFVNIGDKYQVNFRPPGDHGKSGDSFR